MIMMDSCGTVHTGEWIAIVYNVPWYDGHYTKQSKLIEFSFCIMLLQRHGMCCVRFARHCTCLNIHSTQTIISLFITGIRSSKRSTHVCIELVAIMANNIFLPMDVLTTIRNDVKKLCTI